MKIKLLLVLLISAVSAYAQQSRVVGVDSIVAIVEDKIITNDDLRKEISPFVSQIRATSRTEADFRRRLEDLRDEIINNMINRVLIVKDFKTKGMNIPDTYLDSHFDDYIRNEFNGDRAAFLKFLQSENKTVKQFKKEQEEAIIVDYMQSQHRKSIAEISPIKITEYYNANKEKWFESASVKLSQITLKKDDTNAEANAILERLKNGEKFADLARLHSTDTSSAKKGGEWGWYKKGELVPQLDSVAFVLKKDEVSEPIAVGNMVFIIKLDDTHDEGIQDIEAVREQIEWALVGYNQNVEHKKWVERLRRNAYIKFMQ